MSLLLKAAMRKTSDILRRLKDIKAREALEKLEKRRRRDAERKREKYHSDVEYRKREIERKRLDDLKKPEAAKARSAKAYARNSAKRNRERVQWSRDNKERQLATQRRGYGERSDVIGARIVSALRDNRICVDEAARRLGEELARADGKGTEG